MSSDLWWGLFIKYPCGEILVVEQSRLRTEVAKFKDKLFFWSKHDGSVAVGLDSALISLIRELSEQDFYLEKEQRLCPCESKQYRILMYLWKEVNWIFENTYRQKTEVELIKKIGSK